VTLNNNKKYNHQELRNRIKNKSDALREWGSPQKIETIGGNESWYYDFYALGSTPSTEAGALKGNSVLSNKYIEIQFKGEDVTYLRLNGISDSIKQNRFEAGMLKARRIAVGAYVVFVLVAGTIFLSRGGVN